ncbi:MAG: TolC family protein [Flavobacteriaceae bacterium]|jgi:outer membrane protein|nr:TolC family protein [Flavobacteriaceae bacterium]
MRIYICVIVFFISGVTSAQKIWSFNDCLSYARENNLQVLASKFNEQVQENNYKIAKNEKLPTVTGTVSNNFTFGPVAEQSILANGSIGTVYNYVEGYQNDLVLESSILLYNNGSLRKNEEKNSFLLQQYQLITEKIKNEISLQLVGSYLSILLNKELMVVENNSMNTQQQDADRNQKLYNAGSIPLSILYESKANLASAKKLYENAKI